MLEVVKHVHLIVISKSASNADPKTIGTTKLCVESHLKPSNLCEELGGKADAA
jgi:hypothetical protein